MRSTMEQKYPDVQFILAALVGSLVVLTAQGYIMLDNDHFESPETRMWEWSDRVISLGKDPSTKSVFSPTLFCAWEEGRCGSFHEHRKAGG